MNFNGFGRGPRLDFPWISSYVILGGFVRFHGLQGPHVGRADDWMTRWLPGFFFVWTSSILCDLKWICMDFMDSWGPGLRDGISRGWVPLNKQSTCPCKVGKIAGSEVPRLMTGSAGTAMDVLVTCFSKMGGGSGRRGCKDRARCVS